MKEVILRVAVPSPLYCAFDYLPPIGITLKKLQPGIRVHVPFGRQKLVGVILEIAHSSDIPKDKLKPMLELLDQDAEPLFPKSTLELINWVSSYYHHPIGDVVTNALPPALRKITHKKKSKTKLATTEVKAKCINSTIKLNKHQEQAIATINAAQGFNTFLLDGVTGSGKTEVYLHVITKIIAEKKQALVLVPEINLTPQTIARFQERFPVPIVVLHSRKNHQERLSAWLKARDGLAPIIIGTRSAIFTPLKNPGIIIIDEEHDLSFKQQTGLKYSARDLAVVRGKFENIPVVLGSATPALESIFNAEQKRYLHLKLPERAGNALHPSFHVVDMRSQKLHDGIAENLSTAINQHLAKDGQVLIFLNRRGYAPIFLCRDCGWCANCKHCDAKLTLHQKQKQLHCHHCGSIQRVPTKCEKCASENLVAFGAGTERIETALQTTFVDTKIVRIDRDTTRKKGSMQKILQEIHDHNCQILVGTQMLAKGHHFPEVTMAAILNTDHGLFSADFRASEHLAQLVIQVAGRAGRAEKPGEVYLQTHNPQHPLLQRLIKEGYAGFAKAALVERKQANLPPFSHLILIRAEARDAELAIKFLRTLRVKFGANIKNNAVEIFGPIPALMERKAGHFRAQLLFQSNNRTQLHKVIDELIPKIADLPDSTKVKWQIDVDPVEII